MFYFFLFFCVMPNCIWLLKSSVHWYAFRMHTTHCTHHLKCCDIIAFCSNAACHTGHTKQTINSNNSITFAHNTHNNRNNFRWHCCRVFHLLVALTLDSLLFLISVKLNSSLYNFCTFFLCNSRITQLVLIQGNIC